MSRRRLALPVLLSAASLALLLAPPALAPAAASAGPAPTALARVVIRLGAFRGLTVRGCLVQARPGEPARPLSQPVTLQYRLRATGAWRRLTVIQPATGSSYCGAGAPAWSAMVTAPAASAWYRLSFAGTAALSRSASPPVHRWRSPTRVTAYRVTPRRVAAGGVIIISGRLWRRAAAGWRPYPGRQVVVLFRFRGDWYSFVFRPRTNALGYFSGRFRVQVTAIWVAQYDGDAAHFGSASWSARVTVAGG